MVPIAEPSLAARREARRLGIAIAAMMPIIATTMRSSINEKPSWRLVFMLIFMLLKRYRGFKFARANGFPFPCEPRKARSVGGLLNNRCANGRFAQNEEISIKKDRNFDWWTRRSRRPDNLWHGA